MSFLVGEASEQSTSLLAVLWGSEKKIITYYYYGRRVASCAVCSHLQTKLRPIPATD